MDRVSFLVPAQEVKVGRPKFGVFGAVGNRLFYMRTHRGTLGDALKRGFAYSGVGSVYTKMRSWEEYRESLNELLKTLELPEDFPEKVEKYVRKAEEGFLAHAEDVEVTRGKGWLGGEGFEGLIPVELKGPSGSIKLRVHKEAFERGVKPVLEKMPLKSYRERRFWLG